MNNTDRDKYNKLKQIFIETEDLSEEHYKAFQDLQDFLKNK